MAIEKIHRKYDLKGSSWHRKADEGDKVLKDNNLRESDGKFAFGTQREAILKVGAGEGDGGGLRDVSKPSRKSLHRKKEVSSRQTVFTFWIVCSNTCSALEEG